MAEPMKVSKEDYDKFRANMEDKYDYENMSDEEKADFDKKIDQVAVVDDNAENTDETDDEVAEKGEIDGGHPKDRDDEDDDRFL